MKRMLAALLPILLLATALPAHAGSRARTPAEPTAPAQYKVTVTLDDGTSVTKATSFGPAYQVIPYSDTNERNYIQGVHVRDREDDGLGLFSSHTGRTVETITATLVTGLMHDSRVLPLTDGRVELQINLTATDLVAMARDRVVGLPDLYIERPHLHRIGISQQMVLRPGEDMSAGSFTAEAPVGLESFVLGGSAPQPRTINVTVRVDAVPDAQAPHAAPKKRA